MWFEAFALVVAWLVFFGLLVFGVLKAVGMWNSVRLFAFRSGGLTSTFAGGSSAWGEELRFGRRMLFRDLTLREEAGFELDGGRLYLADEMLREDLHFLGGLAGVW